MTKANKKSKSKSNTNSNRRADRTPYNTKAANYPPSLKYEFNRIVSHPQYFHGNPFVIDADVPVDNIIRMFEKGYGDKTIQGKYAHLKQQDLDACRAYQVRFRPETLKDSHHLDPNDKFFLMDENMSYFLLYDVAKTYGWCSHVAAEGMQGKGHNDDEKHIWAHAVSAEYKAVLTADSDFIDISRRHRQKMIKQHGDVHKSPDNTPTVIHIANNISRNKAIYLLNKYEDDIRDFVMGNNHTHARLNENGLERGLHDNELKKAMKSSNDNKPAPPKAP